MTRVARKVLNRFRRDSYSTENPHGLELFSSCCAGVLEFTLRLLPRSQVLSVRQAAVVGTFWLYRRSPLCTSINFHGWIGSLMDHRDLWPLYFLDDTTLSLFLQISVERVKCNAVSHSALYTNVGPDRWRAYAPRVGRAEDVQKSLVPRRIGQGCWQHDSAARIFDSQTS